MAGAHIAPYTAEEAQMMAEDAQLTLLTDVCVQAGDYDDAADLMQRKIALERRFQTSRETTWRVWMEHRYSLEPAGPESRTGYWKPKGGA